MRPLDEPPRLDVPERPPRDWFEPPADLRDDRFLTVEPSGRLYGRFACWRTALLSDDDIVRYPRPSPTKYDKIFHRASVLCDDGTDLDCGTITLGGHGAGGWPSRSDDPANIRAVVRAHDDDLGATFAGSLVSRATLFDADTLRCSQISAEWLPIHDSWFSHYGVDPGNGLELYALVACVTGAAVLLSRYHGHPVHRLDAAEFEARDRRTRQAIAEIIDEHDDPAEAVKTLRAWTRFEETRDARRRVADLKPVRLPTEHVRQPVPSSTRRTP